MSSPEGGSSGGVHLPGDLPLDRFNAFSDGVFAIAITLLVLELPVPTGSDLFESLLEEWPEFLGYLISFAFIGGSWMTHARTTRLMKGGDTLAAGLNLLALLFIALLPFSTSLMVGNLSGPDVRVAVVVYGINVLAASVMLTLLMAYLVRQRALLYDEIADETLASLTRQRWVSNGAWLIGVACAVIAPTVAVVLYVLATVLALGLPFLPAPSQYAACAAFTQPVRRYSPDKCWRAVVSLMPSSWAAAATEPART